MKKLVLYTLEIIIWLALIYFISQAAISVFFPHWSKSKEYVVEMHDINGLIVGSPVRLMGMKIGHISQIKYDYDQVLITMKITKKGLYIPDGTTLEIDAASLGGDRSVELMPAQLETKGMSIKNPRRMVDLYKSADDAVEDLVSGFAQMLSMLNSSTPQELDSKIISSNKRIDDFNTLCNDVTKGMNSYNPKTVQNIKVKLEGMQSKSYGTAVLQEVKEGKQDLDNINSQSKAVYKVTQDISPKNLHENTDKLVKTTEKISSNIEKYDAKKKVDDVNKTAKSIDCFACKIKCFFRHKNIKKMEKKTRELKEKTQKLTDDDCCKCEE